MTGRNRWSEEQDAFLRKIVPKVKKINWTQIMQSVNDKFAIKQRTAKQCRQRFINHACLTQQNKALMDWKNEDIEILYNEFQKHGTRWTKIAQSLPGKSQNSIKNKFYGNLRKAIRKINFVGRNLERKIKKNIRYQSVVRIIEAAETFQNLKNELREESLHLRQMILKFVNSKDQDLPEHEVSKMIDDINKFNLATRSYRPRKPRLVPERDDEDEGKNNLEQDKQARSSKQTVTDAERETIKVYEHFPFLDQLYEQLGLEKDKQIPTQLSVQSRKYSEPEGKLKYDLEELNIEEKGLNGQDIQDLFYCGFPFNESPVVQGYFI